VLRAGLRGDTLDAVLFSRTDPVPRAPEIVATLETVFPPAPGRHVVGPMALIGWGTPTVVTFELALLLELPAPLRLVVLGRMRVLLPGPDEASALVKLNLDALGVLELDRRQASVDATLHDSNVAGFAVSGDMALRASWGERPSLALVVGGFHPRFQAPPGFPALRRVAIALSTGDDPRLRLEAYLALTSYTVQLGARLDLFVSAAGFSLAGTLSFDALVAFEPFTFDVEIAGTVALMAGSTTLMAVDLRLRLTGPAPWRARGTATFQLLFFKVTVSFDARFGAERTLPPSARVDVFPLLREALTDPRNWRTLPPGGDAAIVTLRPMPAAAGEILVHPLGGLAVTQRVVPLDREIGRFANAPPRDHRRFRLESVAVGDSVRAHAPTFEPFARGQFAALSDAERLSSPDFDRMPAGVSVAAGDPTAGPERTVTLEYESILLTRDGVPAPPYRPPAAAVARMASSGAAGVAELRRRGRGAFAVDDGAPIAVTEPEWVVTSRDSLVAVAGAADTDGSYTSALEALTDLRTRDPRARAGAQVVRRSEIPTSSEALR